MRTLSFFLVLAAFSASAAANKTGTATSLGADPVLCADTSLRTQARTAPQVALRDQHNKRAHRVRATLAALFPGVLIHGSGHYAAGDTKTGNRLLLTSAVGAGLAITGGASLFWTGANRRVSEMGIPLLVSGLGIFGASWLADVYGSATGGTKLSSAVPPNISASLGYAHVDDPQFSYEHFATAESEFRWAQVALRPSLWSATVANNWRARIEASYSLYTSPKGTRVRIQSAATHHAFSDDGFATRVYEASVVGRWSLGDFGPRLAGAFADLSVGFGHETIQFETPGASNTGATLLLGRVGFGMQTPRGGESSFYYDHRRDTLAGGLSPSKRRGSGFAGHLGLRHRQPLGGRFAIRLATELGSAWVASGALEARWGKLR